MCKGCLIGFVWEMVAPGDGLLRVSIQMLIGTKPGMPLLHMIQLILGISIKRFTIFRYTDILREKSGILVFDYSTLPAPAPAAHPPLPPLREYFCHQVTKHSTPQTSFSRFSEYTLHGLYLNHDAQKRFYSLQAKTIGESLSHENKPCPLQHQLPDYGQANQQNSPFC